MKIKNIAFAVTGAATPGASSNSEILKRVQNVASSAYKTEATDQYSLSAFAGTIVNVALGLLGVLFVILTIYAGFLWMTSSGDKEKVGKATKIISYSIAGLLIIVAAYALWNFVLIRLIL